uniref:glucose-6-phosphate 1-epimerase n=1 Tax=Trypanosoma congolense (strain IL3000) TaxID=1068625 RepID=G0UKU7_TRYCI|nr:conserved hypothetical protein [Trypanosoma congolense IL3000]
MTKSPVVAGNEDGSSITVHLQGAHLTNWRRREGDELLYTSPKAVYKEGVPIRGGVPIIFPQFGNMGPLPPHGFARVRPWTVNEIKNGSASFKLDVPLQELLGHDSGIDRDSSTGQADPAAATNVAELVYTITFSNSKLDLHMEVLNKDPVTVAEFTFAFHTYFAVGDVEKTVVEGVNMTSYIDNMRPRQGVLPPKRLWTIKKETDRTYLNQACAVLLVDGMKGRTIYVSGENLPDVVVWNPHVEKTLRLKDLPADGYKEFVCVEHGTIAKRVKLQPLLVWSAHQHIIVLPRSKM